MVKISVKSELLSKCAPFQARATETRDSCVPETQIFVERFVHIRFEIVFFVQINMKYLFRQYVYWLG